MKKKLLFVLIGLLRLSTNAQCWQSVSAGGAHTLAVAINGTLWSWGLNSSGQLGNGTNTTAYLPAQVGTTTNWVAISAGNGHSLAIKSDGTLWAWGRNTDGQLGNGFNVNLNIPVQIGTDTDWQSIAAGDEYSTAIKTNGTLWAWGDNAYGQLGDGSITDKNTPTKITSDTNWQFVSAGTFHTLAIKTNGTLYSWGRNQYGQLGDGNASILNTLIPTQVGLDNAWSNIAAGLSHSVGSKTDGSLWTWGYNLTGQLGDGTTVDKPNPTNISAVSGCEIVSKGQQHTIIKKSDGSFWSWGSNSVGQLGDGTNTQRLIPTSVFGSSTNWIAVSSRVSHTVGIRTDGSIWSWGSNAFGQLGTGLGPSLNVPTKVTCPTLGVDENAFVTELFIYPNPTNSNLTIKANNFTFDKIIIVDLAGKKVFETNGNSTSVNVENLADGMYIIKAFSEEKSFQSKFVKN
jgi:alpha-tubulin suppressor-like RCC1 family protein